MSNVVMETVNHVTPNSNDTVGNQQQYNTAEQQVGAYQNETPVQQPLAIEQPINTGGVTPPPVVDSNNPIEQQPRRVSALSLTSIRNRKELASSLEKVVINPDDLPKEQFTYEQLMGEWNYFIDRLTRGGLMLMASLMRMAQPALFGARIELELPNEGSKLSFEENKYELVNYLRKKLQNFDIELNITVNEEIKLVKRVLDSKDKYQHFIEVNPDMEILREMFDLEIK